MITAYRGSKSEFIYYCLLLSLSSSSELCGLLQWLWHGDCTINVLQYFIVTIGINNYYSVYTHTHTQPFYGSVESVWDNPGEPVPEETFTHSHSSWSSIIPICFLHLLRTIASSAFSPRALQSFSTISPSLLWSTSWPGTLHFILHTFLHTLS